MSCRFCNSPTPRRQNTCAMCLGLIRSGAWHLLADFWLTYRPEDWTDDVAAFLEITEGLGAEPPRVQYASGAMSATASVWCGRDTGTAMNELAEDYDREAHDRCEIRRRLAMTPAERVRANAALYRLWVIRRKRHAEKVAQLRAGQAKAERNATMILRPEDC